jgi:endonuclease-8
MAEGPLVHHYANRLRRVLKGKEVRVEFGIKKLKQFELSLEGLRVHEVEAYGKQFRIHFPEDRVLLVHLMMWGSWRFYRNGEAWDKPRERARLVLRTLTHDVVAFSTPIVRLLTKSELKEDPKWGNPGPDPLRPDFSIKEFFRLLKEQSAREIGDVLLDQRVISGIGNILRVEILFRSRIHPRRLVGSLSENERNEILRWVMKLTQTWMKNMRKKNNWISIYRKSGKPCPHCGAIIEFFRQAGRITYACPRCQQLAGGPVKNGTNDALGKLPQCSP